MNQFRIISSLPFHSTKMKNRFSSVPSVTRCWRYFATLAKSEKSLAIF